MPFVPLDFSSKTIFCFIFSLALLLVPFLKYNVICLLCPPSLLREFAFNVLYLRRHSKSLRGDYKSL